MTKVFKDSNIKVFNSNKDNTIESNNTNIIEADSEEREVIKKGYLLNNINLTTIPEIIKDAINKAMIDTKEVTLSDSLIQTLKHSLENLDDGVYKKTYIDNIITFLQETVSQKVNEDTVAAIANSRISVAAENFASTASVETLNNRVGNSEVEIQNVKNAVNTESTARAGQITDLEASINDAFAAYSEAIDLQVDAEGNVKSQKIETLTTNIGLQIQELNELVTTSAEDWYAKSIKLITAPGGAITGYSFQDGSGMNSNFNINADNFKISNSFNTYTPFSIVGTSLFFNGKVTFSNITGGDSILTADNIQDAINNNVTQIDGGKIVTNQAFANSLMSNNIEFTGVITGGEDSSGGKIRSYTGNMEIDLVNGSIYIL
uniref:hypothetical protein n=1 Tax=Aliarcobacter sp. TaxID=2321116 RepID=UPI00404878E9